MTTNDLSTLVDRLVEARPDLDVHYSNTGGGVMCIVAGHGDDTIYIGTGSGNLGWSDALGEAHGEWEVLTGFDPQDAVNGRVDLAFDFIVDMFATQLPVQP